MNPNFKIGKKLGPMQKDHFISAAGCVLNEAGDVLLIQSPHRGWEFPGGMVEPGESLPTALLREIYEETGIQAEISSFVGICKNLQLDIVNLDFRCRYKSGVPTPSAESNQVIWVAPAKAIQMVEHPLTRKRLLQLLSMTSDISYFAFRKDPFQVIEEWSFPVNDGTSTVSPLQTMIGLPVEREPELKT